MSEGEHHNLDTPIVGDKQVAAPPTIGSGGRRLTLYPQRRAGERASKRKLLAFFLILFYFAAPWIEVAGRPMFRIDVLEQKTYLFGLVFALKEYSLIFFIFAAALAILFLVTTLRGRVWCGYACPQTVFVEWLVRPIEEWVEGDFLKRKKLDSSPLTFEKLRLKTTKHMLLFLAILVVSNAFLGFFFDPKTVLLWMTSSPLEHWGEFLFVMFINALLYFDLVIFREQFCSFLCPYARFQSAFIDRSSPAVGYDTKRGEPRGKGSGKGDCINCGLCVRVCPTGIDIRDGLQLECIQCERCIDACDSVMEKIDRPKGLVRIDTENKFSGRKDHFPIYKRSKVVIYSLLIVALFALAAKLVIARPTIELAILRLRGSTYEHVTPDRLSNKFELKLINTTSEQTSLNLHALDEQVRFICPLCAKPLGPYEERTTPLIITFPKGFSLKKTTFKYQGGMEIEVPLLKGQ